MATARVRIGSRGSTGTIADPSVRAAVEAVWSRNGGRAFGATLYGTGRWSRPEFAELLDPEVIELPFGYHPQGTVGRSRSSWRSRRAAAWSSEHQRTTCLRAPSTVHRARCH